MTSVRRFLAAFLLASVTSLAAPTVGYAQTLPDALTVKQRLTDEDKSAIETFVKSAKPGLLGDPEQISRARAALLRPLGANASLQFRLEYAAALRPVLDEVAASAKHQSVINAMRIAGEAAATGTLPILLSKIDSEAQVPPGVRIAACVGLARLFEVTAKFDPAVNPADLKRAATVVADTAAKSPDALVADAAIRALNAALEIPAAKADATFRDDVVGKLAAAAGKRAAGLGGVAGGADMPSVLRAARALRDVITADASTNKGQINESTYRAAAEFAGDVAVAVVRLRASPVAGLDSATVEQAAGAAGTIVALSKSLLQRGRKVEAPKDISDLIGPDGTLTQPPFSFAKDRFKP